MTRAFAIDMQQKPILQRSRVCPAPCRTAAVCKRAAAGGGPKRNTLTARLAAVVDRAEAVPRILRAGELLPVAVN